MRPRSWEAYYRGALAYEIREGTLGRYLEPGDEVTLEVDRLGRLVTPIVGRAARDT